MASFLVYLLSTGVIDRSGSVPDGQEAVQAQAGEVVMLNPGGATGDTHYVSLGPPPVLTAKAAMGATIDKTFINATGSDIATVSNVPPGSMAYVDDVLADGNIADGSVEFASSTMGINMLRIEHRAYLPAEFRIRVGVIEAPLIVVSERMLPTCCTPPPIREVVTILPLGG